MKQSLTARFKKALSYLFAVFEREKIWLAFMAALILVTGVYRLELAAIIYTNHSSVEDLQPAAVSLGEFIKAPINDFHIISLIGFCCLVIKSWLRWRLPQFTAGTFFCVVETVTAVVVLLLLALIERTHYQLLLQLDTGLTMTFLKMMPVMFGPGDFFHLLSLWDLIFLAVPFVCFVMALTGHRWLLRIYKPVFVCLTALILAAQLVPGRQKLPADIYQNPVFFVLNDALRDALNTAFRSNDYYEHRADLPDEEQMHAIRLMDEAFVTPTNPPTSPRRNRALTADGELWNVMIFVLESTGADYAFDTSLGNKTPMPFLQKLAREGLYLANHHASANNSAQAAFSIFSGLYACTSHTLFPMQQNVVIPTLNRYLPDNYSYFLVHPTDPDYWFPKFMFLNNGLREFDNRETMPPGQRPELSDLARNEIDSFDFLQRRLDDVREPFLGVYWSFAPHYPYSDYGPDYRILPGNNKQQRYYNNLRLLDTQLQRIVEHLKTTGVADHTLFVFVGDHGEAFEQHPGVWAHSFGSYSEMYRVPMLFWQPKLIPPQTITFPTSHADIVPTLLDVLGISYDPSKFQGESVLRGPPQRKYIFTMDAYADNISAISEQMKKVSISFNSGNVTAFDLAKDPKEQAPLDENHFPEQIEAIIKFRNFQSRMIETYNQSILDGYPFPPKHSLRAAAGK
jgi:phosphoglycerol transferase MdoB-like AlkP superfamily enzyme